MPMLYTSKIKFDVDINNVELFETHMRGIKGGMGGRGGKILFKNFHLLYQDSYFCLFKASK
jgi:hypothetical protein